MKKYLLPSVVFLFAVTVLILSGKVNLPNSSNTLNMETIEQDLQEQINLDSLNPINYKLLIEVYIQQQKFEDALIIARLMQSNILQLDLLDQFLVEEVYILNDQNHLLLDQTRQLLNEIINTDNSNIKAYWYLGLSDLILGNSDQVLLNWSRLMELSPGEPLASFVQSQLDILNGQSFEIPVQIEISDELMQILENFNEISAMYIFARESVNTPPFAATRIDEYEIGQIYTLSNLDLMIPNEDFQIPSSFTLTARISISGDPIASGGDLFGVIDIEGYISEGQLTPLILLIDQIFE